VDLQLTRITNATPNSKRRAYFSSELVANIIIAVVSRNGMKIFGLKTMKQTSIPLAFVR